MHHGCDARTTRHPDMISYANNVVGKTAGGRRAAEKRAGRRTQAAEKREGQGSREGNEARKKKD